MPPTSEALEGTFWLLYAGYKTADSMHNTKLEGFSLKTASRSLGNVSPADLVFCFSQRRSSADACTFLMRLTLQNSSAYGCHWLIDECDLTHPQQLHTQLKTVAMGCAVLPLCSAESPSLSCACSLITPGVTHKVILQLHCSNAIVWNAPYQAPGPAPMMAHTL